jgi:Ca2+-binding RTX toxin-like protein
MEPGWGEPSARGWLIAGAGAGAHIDQDAIECLRGQVAGLGRVRVAGSPLVVQIDLAWNPAEESLEALCGRIGLAAAELRRSLADVRGLGYVGWHAGADAGLLAAVELRRALAAVVAVGPHLEPVLPTLSRITAPTLLIRDPADSWLLGRRAIRRLPAESELLRRSLSTRADVRAVDSIANAWIERFITAPAARPAPYLNRRLRRRLVKLAPAAAVVVGAIAATGSPAADGSCTPEFDDAQGVLTVTCLGTAESKLAFTHDEEAIYLNEQKVAPFDATTLVKVVGSEGNEDVWIDESTGRFEAKFDLDLGADARDALTYAGQKGDDTAFMKEAGLYLKEEGDVDVKLAGLELVSLSLGDGNDFADASGWELTPVTIKGELGDDTIVGGKLGDILSGGLGFNKLDGGDGIDLISEEISRKDFPGQESKLWTVDADLAVFEDTLSEQKLRTEFAKIELFEAKVVDELGYLFDASKFTTADIKYFGGPDKDVILGGQKADVLFGLGGDDKLSAGLGFNKLDGGDGVDLAYEELKFSTFASQDFQLSTQDADLSIFQDKASPLQKVRTELDKFEAFEAKVADELAYKFDASQYKANVSFFGGPDKDVFLGGYKEDVAFGLGGDDFIDAGPGDDKADGGLGNDRLFGGLGVDVVMASGNTDYKLTDKSLIGLGTDAFSGFEGALLEAGPGDNVIDASAYRAGAVSLLGLEGDDLLQGGALGDLLDGGIGDDRLDAGRGNDSLLGDIGDDALDGGPGTDTGDGGPGGDSCRSIEIANSCEA